MTMHGQNHFKSITTFVKGKGKVIPVQNMKAYEGVEAQFLSVLTLAVCGE
jgi:hypothetical protein